MRASRASPSERTLPFFAPKDSAGGGIGIATQVLGYLGSSFTTGVANAELNPGSADLALLQLEPMAFLADLQIL